MHFTGGSPFYALAPCLILFVNNWLTIFSKIKQLSKKYINIVTGDDAQRMRIENRPHKVYFESLFTV